MRFWVGITDREWFEHLGVRAPDEVNFWQPSSRRLAAFLEPGVPFLFKLHAPDNYIVGGGFFVRFSALPARLAWEAFGEKNGVNNYQSLRQRVAQYRGVVRGDPEIGCNIIDKPFFFDRSDWIPVPASWKPNVQRGLTYNTEENDGLTLWNSIADRLRGRAATELEYNDIVGMNFHDKVLQPQNKDQSQALRVCQSAKRVRNEIAHLRMPNPNDINSLVSEMDSLMN
ncbi:MAG: hypothetical protein IH606_07125 [Burkholderiales bacterium]|nr:hypothetical protein [Burkholderiales bacterium]